MHQTRLFYLIGPSGCGKDTLLQAIHQQGWPDLLIAHRYITRPADAGGENHIALSEAEFARRQQAGLFALAWQAHQQHYAVGVEIHAWLAAGFHVMINGSRAYLDEARRIIGQRLVPIGIEVAPDCLARRLRERGREDAAAIEARLARAKEFAAWRPADMIALANDGPLADTQAQLRRLLADYPLE